MTEEDSELTKRIDAMIKDAERHSKEGKFMTLSGLEVIALCGMARPADPMWDGTDGVHPAWRRGNEAGVLEAVMRINQALDGTDDGTGVIGNEALEQCRQSILRLKEACDIFEKNSADAVQLDIANKVYREWIDVESPSALEYLDEQIAAKVKDAAL